MRRRLRAALLVDEVHVPHFALRLHVVRPALGQLLDELLHVLELSDRNIDRNAAGDLADGAVGLASGVAVVLDGDAEPFRIMIAAPSRIYRWNGEGNEAAVFGSEKLLAVDEELNIRDGNESLGNGRAVAEVV